MSIDRHLQEKIYRLETLRKYQSYYGPNTPYQIIVEINQLETELRRMLKADVTRPAQPVSHGSKAKKAGKRPSHKSAKKPAPAKKAAAQEKPNKAKNGFWNMSQATSDLVITIAFIGLVFLLGAIVFAAYIQTRPGRGNTALAQSEGAIEVVSVLRPTFTPTLDPNNPQPAQPVTESINPDAVGASLLPPAEKVATEVPTAVPTITPKPPVEPTATSTSLPTNTPEPTKPPPPPPPPLPPTATSNAPTPVPAPAFPFSITEQGNRMFQSTSYHGITVYVAIVSEGNVPIGGLKIVGDHVPGGAHAESALSDWHWSAVNCLDCDYVKFGNVKFEPGPQEDGTWNIYVADAQGNRLSAPLPLTYSSDPAQWTWDFVIFQKQGW